MDIPFFHVDTFTNQQFSGNPAMVCLLSDWLAEEKLQAIATEHNLPATTFLVRTDDAFAIRWFSPEKEIELCGHGSLAAALVIFNLLEPDWHEAQFNSLKAGLVRVRCDQDLFQLNFPARKMTAIAAPELLLKGLGVLPNEVYEHVSSSLVAVLNDEETIQKLNPDMSTLSLLSQDRIVITAKSKRVDFVSRTFYPKKTSMKEDSVTGSSHCLLIPYWAKKLHKKNLQAYQVSPRGGELFCQDCDEHVLMSGAAVLYSPDFDRFSILSIKKQRKISLHSKKRFVVPS